MVEYHDDGDRITDMLDTHGIVSQEYLDEGDVDIEWVSAFSPRILRQTAELIEFCYPDAKSVDVGFIDSPNMTNNSRGMIVGKAGGDRFVAIAERTDGYVDTDPVKRDYCT